MFQADWNKKAKILAPCISRQISCCFLVAALWLKEIYCNLQVQGSHVLIFYWWHFPAGRAAWVVRCEGERALWCLIQQRKRIFGRNKFFSNNLFRVIINFTGKHLQLQLPSSRRHQFHIKTAASATGKKTCPQTQMMLNDYADYDLGAASFVSNCALLCGRGPCVV